MKRDIWARRWRLGALLTAAALIAAACADSTTLDRFIDGGDATSGLDADTDGPSPDDATDPNSDDGTSSDEGDNPDSSLQSGSAPDPDPTPLPVDDDYRIGVLDNGLTYLLRSNDTPGASLDLRLVINAGSAQQPVGDDGSAHFLEHMLFNGTETYPGNELTLQLQRLGISFGPELNAFTSYDETVYLLAATTIDPASPDVAFDVLAQWASAATLDPSAVAAEVGVVRDELRQGRESVGGQIFTEFEEIYSAGTPYEGHIVIGDADKVEATTADVLRTYYDDWYRPDNMAVVVVGDLPLDRLEAMVEEYFSALTPRNDSPPVRDVIDIEISAEPQAHIVTHPDNAFDNLSLDFPLPIWDSGTIGGARLGLMETGLAIMLTNRLQAAFQRGDLILDQEPGIGEFWQSRGLRYYGTNLQTENLTDALSDYMAELLSAAVDGFTDDDVARMQAELLASLDDELSGLGTTQDFQHAGALMTYWLEGGDIDRAEDRIARQRAAIESFTPDELTNHWRWLLSVSGPILVAVGADEATLPTPAELLDVYARAVPVDAGETADQIDELMASPEAVDPIESDRSSTFGGEVFTWTFANGVTVSFQHSEIVEGNFTVWTESAGGWSSLDPSDPGANAAIPGVALNAVIASGVGPHDPATLSRFLSTRGVSISGSIDELTEGFFGTSASDDAEVFFQLLHLFVTQPRVDEVAFRTAINQAEQGIAFSETDVDSRALDALQRILTNNTANMAAIPSQTQLDSLTAEEALDLYRARLGKVDDMHVAIVGDVGPGEIRDLISRYIGTLPTGDPDSWTDFAVPFPTGVQTAEVALSESASDGGLLVAHSGPITLSAKNRVTAALLEGIINTRIVEKIREELAASYGGFASITIGREARPSVSSFIQIDGDPTRLDEIRNSLRNELDDLATNGPSADEFDRAGSVLENDWNFVNDFLFLETNLAATRFPDEDHLTPDNRLPLLGQIDSADVHALASQLYGDGDWVEVAKVLP